MAENSSIEWCDHTFNPWIGCTRISPGCDNCYAAVSTPVRTMGLAWGAGEPRHRTLTWSLPKRWNAQHEAFQARYGRRQRVFCASLADVFDNEVPPNWRAELFDLILATPKLDWLLLTKRIGNAAKMMADALGVSVLSAQLPPANVWLGATVVNQEETDRDIPKLLATPARVRFLSMEPLLGPVEFSNVGKRADAVLQLGKKALAGIDWVIVGGESGHGARPMHPDWARSLRDQCAAAGVPFLFKQWGEWWPHDQGQWVTPAERHVHHDDEGDFHRIGKKAAGRQLDGITHDGFPGEPT